MNKKHLSALLAMLLPLLAGCAGGTYDLPALDIEIRDARTSAPAWYDATVIFVRDGVDADTVRGSRGFPPEARNRWGLLSSPANRPGVYDVTILHPESQTWHRAGIRVEKGGNNPFDAGSSLPKTVHLLAELQPLDAR